jgi:hypothetical protein
MLKQRRMGSIGSAEPGIQGIYVRFFLNCNVTDSSPHSRLRSPML